MRGTQSQKQIIETNKTVIKIILISLAMYNVLTLIIYYINVGLMLNLFTIYTIPELLCTLLLLKLSSPKFKKEKNVTTIVDPGASLNSKGLISWLFDGLFVSMLVKIGVVFSNYFALLYLIVVASGIYEFLYKPFSSITKTFKAE